MQKPTRRQFLSGATALPLVGILPSRAGAAEFRLKFATGQDPSHPVNRRAQEAIDRIKAATGGRVEINLFPANQLGSDTDLISQIRFGAIDYLNMAGVVLATLVPHVGVVSTGFAFPSYEAVWRAMDGDLGAYVKSEIEAEGLLLACKAWNNGFRDLTTTARQVRTPSDIRGLKMRVPAAPILTSLFQALGAGPTPINFNELYSALQTRIVEGQENPLPIIATAKLYEVQKYCSLTGHVWDPYFILANRRSFARLPPDFQTIVTRELDKAADEERADTMALSRSLRADLTAKGMQFLEVDKPAFRAALAKTTFYKDWREKFGDKGWSLLEAAVGQLA